MELPYLVAASFQTEEESQVVASPEVSSYHQVVGTQDSRQGALRTAVQHYCHQEEHPVLGAGLHQGDPSVLVWRPSELQWSWLIDC